MPPNPSSSNLEYTLLGLLRDMPQHGYELHKQISELADIGPVWYVKQANLYAMLDRLEAEGLIIGQETHPVEARLPRREYHLTSSGEAALNIWQSTPVDRPRDMRQVFLLRLYFARRASLSTALALLRAQHKICCTWQEEIKKQDDPEASPSDYPYWVHQFRKSNIQNMLIWLETCQQSILSVKEEP